MGDLQKVEFLRAQPEPKEEHSPLIRALLEHLRKYKLLKEEKKAELIRVK